MAMSRQNRSCILLISLCLSIILVDSAICADTAGESNGGSEIFNGAEFAGIRSAEYLDANTVKILIGPGFNGRSLAGREKMFQLVSPSDNKFQCGIGAESVVLAGSKDDIEYPASWKGEKFQVFELLLKFPSDKTIDTAKHKYWIRVNSDFLVAKNKRSEWLGNPQIDLSNKLGSFYGIREISVVSPKAVKLSLGCGIYLAGLKKENISINSNDDDDFKSPSHPDKIGRRSNLDFYIPSGWPWKYVQKHDLFLILDKNLKQGKTYRISFAPGLTCGRSEIELKLRDSESINQSIKVNQLGYLPDSKEKFAYVGLWMGDLNAYDFSGEIPSFEVRQRKTNEPVMKGIPALRRKATYKLENGKLDPDPAKVKGPETVYKADLSYEDIYEIDLSSLTAEGEYYVSVPGMGRSLPFRVSSNIYETAFTTVMNGLLHQRCGIELKEPFSTRYRPACHRNCTEYSSFRAGMDKDPISALAKYATDGVKHDMPGGHHDAGDWNPRAHIEVAEMLFLLYELNGDRIKDIVLNIPEKGNKIPDVIDEALWALNLWKYLQDEDGGVRNGIESNGDPREGDSAGTDSLREFAFAKDATGSLRFAGTAAHAYMILKKIGEIKDAEDFLSRALKAWDWAEKNGANNEKDMRAYASAMLFRATGDKKFDQAFKESCIISDKPDAPPLEYGKHDQTAGMFYYAINPSAEEEYKGKISTSFEKLYQIWEKFAETTSYRYMRSPYSPNTWGTGGIPVYIVFPAMTMSITANGQIRESCRKWIALTNDFSLGCHPLNLVFTAGLGQRYIYGCWHHLAENTPGGIIPGMQSEGAGGKWVAGQKGGKSMADWPAMSLYPSGQWPDLYKYSDNASPGMNEGVTVNMAKTALAYGIMIGR